MYIFISHSSKDAAGAKEVCGLLESNGHGCFLAPRDIRAGREYAQEIIEGIDRADVLVLLLSENANQSPHVLREIERAVSRGIPIVVYKMEEVNLTKSMEYFLMMHQWTSGETDGDYNSILKCIDGMELEKGMVQSNEAGGNKKKGEGKAENSRKKSRIIAAAVTAAAILFAVWILNYGFGTPVGGRSNKTELNLGDSVTLGTYNGQDIVWRVLHFSEDGKNAVLVSDQILMMKAFDGAESGIFNFDGDISYSSVRGEELTDPAIQYRVRGNSDWESSNLRTWLNSAQENVEYSDQPPVAQAMCEGKNAYNAEPGFLSGFTAEEQKLLAETELRTETNALYDVDSVTTRDKVFLLSMEELGWFGEANVNLYAVPTDKAVELDGTNSYDILSLTYDTAEFFWWLRDPVEDYASRCYVVANGYNGMLYDEYVAAAEGIGVRPAICVDVEALEEFLSEQ